MGDSHTPARRAADASVRQTQPINTWHAGGIERVGETDRSRPGEAEAGDRVPEVEITGLQKRVGRTGHRIEKDLDVPRRNAIEDEWRDVLGRRIVCFPELIIRVRKVGVIGYG